MIARAAALCLALTTGAGAFAIANRMPDPAGTDGTSPGGASVAAARLALPTATAALACPGPETTIVPDGGSAEAAGPFALTAAAAGPDAGRSALAPLAGGDVVAAFEAGRGLHVLARNGDPHAPLRLAAAPSGSTPTRLSAVQTTLTRGGDLRGLVAGSCVPASSSSWLVGGGTAPGRRGRLLLANPTPAPAVVDVLVAGPSGAVDVPSGRGLVVAPGRVRAVQLDALAPGLDRLAVHVVARRGQVAVLLHDNYVRGATAAGADDVPVAAPPGRHLVVPGVVLPAAPAGGGAAATVRLVAPGRDDAVVHLHLSGPAGDAQLPGSGVVTVPAGGVADVPLSGLAPGAYAVLADADVPIVAGAVITVTGPASGPLRTAPADVGWATATAPLHGDVVTSLPWPIDSHHAVVTRPSVATRLALTAGDADTDVTMRQVAPDGSPLRQTVVHVHARRTVAVDLGSDAAALALSVPAGRAVWAGVAAQVGDRAGPLVTLLSLAPPVAAAKKAPVAVADPWLQAP